MKKPTSKVESRKARIASLTPTEKEVLHLLTEEHRTIKAIAYARQVSHQAVYKIVKKLRQKGFLTPELNKVASVGCTLQPCNHPIRLHGQEFCIKILRKDEHYDATRKKSNWIMIDGSRVTLNRNSLEVYSGKDFYGKTHQEAKSEGLAYWLHFFCILENDLHISILKDRYQNIKIVKEHYAEINNEVSKEYAREGKTIKVKATEDGKVWLTYDDSHDLKEAETIHPETSKQDGESLVRHYNDIRDNDPPVLSEITLALLRATKTIERQAEMNAETAAACRFIASVVSQQHRIAQEETTPPLSRDKKPYYFG